MIYILYGTNGFEETELLAAFRDQDKAYEVRQKCEEHAQEEPKPIPHHRLTKDKEQEWITRYNRWKEESPVKTWCNHFYIQEMELQ